MFIITNKAKEDFFAFIKCFKKITGLSLKESKQIIEDIILESDNFEGIITYDNLKHYIYFWTSLSFKSIRIDLIIEAIKNSKELQTYIKYK